jgi:hypothetical protein
VGRLPENENNLPDMAITPAGEDGAATAGFTHPNQPIRIINADANKTELIVTRQEGCDFSEN